MESEKNTPKRVASAGGQPNHIKGTIGTTPVTINVTNQDGKKTVSTHIKIQNTSTNRTLEVRLDGGSNGFTIRANRKESFNCCVESFVLVGSAQNTSYEGIITV